MTFRSHERSYRDYEVNLGTRCRIKTTYGWIYGVVEGLGAAGHYVEVRGDDGRLYDGTTSYPDFEKIFSD